VAKLYPPIENINRLKVKPTDGEMFLLNYLVENLADDVEVYFQPFLNGDRPDIILMEKKSGVTIIEVKDWNLKSYTIDIDNKWYLQNIDLCIKSPFQQVFGYKNNLFNLHINGLLEKKIKNKNFYKLIKQYVYFHNISKHDIDVLYDNAENYYINEISINYESHKRKEIEFDRYAKKDDYLKKKQLKLIRDKNLAITSQNLKHKSKSLLPGESKNSLFEESIYLEFQRYLQPPYHVASEGKEIIYSKKQSQLITSKPVHQKVKGVAGSGKTVVLAKRAVNAHIRNEDAVLVLTFNLTLKSYIHDRISDVRENFDWKYFHITNYHQLIRYTLNNLNIEIILPEGLPQSETSILFDKVYCDIDIFKNHEQEIPQYKSIFIDEIQDYKPEWIKIIRKYFLADSGEMVLFGDEKQNIYERTIDTEKNSTVVQGFGRWEKLNQSIRQKEDSHILKLANSFQKIFFDGKYELDNLDLSTSQPQLASLGINKYSYYSKNNYASIVSSIFENIKANNIHPNDVSILSSQVSILREVDFLIRTDFNEKTKTTFEDKEMYGSKSLDTMDLSNLRNAKKVAFNHNSGVVKLATIHSFKGYESPTIFLIINDDDNEELIYTGITRAKENIMVFIPEKSKYDEFFKSQLEKEP